MKATKWFLSLVLIFSMASCGEQSQSFNEVEKKTQDSLDQLNQDAAFDELLEEDNIDTGKK